MIDKLKQVAEELRKLASEVPNKDKLDSQQVINFLKFYAGRPVNK